jgi:hypothetical protein
MSERLPIVTQTILKFSERNETEVDVFTVDNSVPSFFGGWFLDAKTPFV